MQIWQIYHENEIDTALLKLSTAKYEPAIVVTTKAGDQIAAEKYDAAATHAKDGMINAYLRIGTIRYTDDDYYYDLEHTQLYPRDIKQLAVCDRFVAESESPEEALKPGMKVRITRNDLDTIYVGELTAVAFLDVVIKTESEEVSIPVSKIRTVVIL